MELGREEKNNDEEYQTKAVCLDQAGQGESIPFNYYQILPFIVNDQTFSYLLFHTCPVRL